MGEPAAIFDVQFRHPSSALRHVTGEHQLGETPGTGVGQGAFELKPYTNASVNVFWLLTERPFFTK